MMKIPAEIGLHELSRDEAKLTDQERLVSPKDATVDALARELSTRGGAQIILKRMTNDGVRESVFCAIGGTAETLAKYHNYATKHIEPIILNALQEILSDVRKTNGGEQSQPSWVKEVLDKNN